jgi:hypothetical protein
MNRSAASAKYNVNAEPLFQKKAAAYQYLSVNPVKFINVGLFQGMIWSAGNSRNAQRLGWEYFNPMIFSNVLSKGLDDSCNILTGADLRIKLPGKISLYGQVMADHLEDTVDHRKGWGYQAGICFYDLFRVKNLFFQTEYNFVNEGSYRSPSGSNTGQSYTHNGQGLAFSPGYGNELVLIGNYKIKRFDITLKYHKQEVPKDNDYFYDTELVNFTFGYLANPAYNLNLSFGYTFRNQNFPNFKDASNQTNYLFVALRTGLYNLYYDY